MLRDLKVQRLLPAVTAGVVAGIVEIVVSISLAALLFAGPPSSHLGAGIGIALWTAAVMGITAALLSSFPPMVAAPQDSPAAILALMVAAVAARMPPGATADQMLSTVAVAIAIATLVTGVCFFALGWYRLGGLVRYIPFPVVGGFLAGSGWLLIQGSIIVMTDTPLGLSTLGQLAEPRVLAQWLPGAAYAVALLVVLRHSRHILVMPAMLVAGVAVFYAALLATGTTLGQAAARGWLLPSLPTGDLWTPLDPRALGHVSWSVVLGHLDLIAIAVVVSILGLLLNASGVELAVERDVDLDRELRAAGVANVVAGLGGGLIGFQTLGTSVLAHRMRADSRLVGIVDGAMCGAALLCGPALLWLVPKPILGGLLLFLGLSFLVEWVYDAWFKLPKADYALVMLILVVIGAVGFLEGVAVGVVVAITVFVVNYSRVSIVRHALTGAERQSSVDRPPDHRRLLRQHGGALYLLKLQGFIFFGTASSLLDQMRGRTGDVASAPVRYVVLDFQRVIGIDSSAVWSFVKMKQVARAQEFALVFTHLSPRIRRLLSEGAVLEPSSPVVHAFPDVDHALEWCENQLLAAARVPVPEERRRLVDQLAELTRDPAVVERLMGHLHRIELAPGDCLIRQGDPPTYMYFIESGRLAVEIEGGTGPGLRIGTRQAGTIVGELGLYLGAPRTASLVADRPSTVYRLSGSALEKMETTDPDVANAFHRFMVRLLAERLVNATRTMQVLQD